MAQGEWINPVPATKQRIPYANSVPPDQPVHLSHLTRKLNCLLISLCIPILQTSMALTDQAVRVDLELIFQYMAYHPAL